MNSTIETLNHFGGQFLHFAWPVFWQSSLLIAFIFALDVLLARKIRASIRYGLWMVVLVKLLLPPTLALPTGAAWWLTQGKPAINTPIAPHYFMTYGKTTSQTDLAPQTIPIPEARPVQLSGAGWALLASGVVSLALLLWLTRNWWQVTRKVRGAKASDEHADALKAAQQLAGLSSGVRLKIVEGRMSPAVCGLIRPVILLPRTLLDKISAAQLCAVLLHELFHLRRGDVWVNCAQALLQMAYWWHPLLWIANARIRRVREEAVDDAVMLALREDAETYAPTLLEVAKLAFQRPLMSLGLVGIMESRSALRQRIERLVDFHAPRKAGLTFASLFGIFVFSAVALPMGEAPAPAAKQIPSAAMPGQPPQQINITGQFVEVPETFFTSVAGNPLPAGMTNGTGILTEVEARALIQRLKSQPGVDVLALPNVTTLAGRQVQLRATQIFTALTNSVPSKENSNPQITAAMQSGKIETGPVLDVIPQVLSDGFTIDLRTIASVTEFLGYADGTNMAPQAVTNSMPAVRLRTKAAHTRLFAGQTQVLFPKSEPVLLGAPDKQRDVRVADYIRQIENRGGKKILVVFVTPTLRDPASKLVYPDDDAPVAKDHMPKQER